MKKIAFICTILAMTMAAQSADDSSAYRKIAMEISELKPKLKSGTVAILPFASEGFSDRSQGSYVADKIGAALSETGKLTLVERERLDRVLKEKELTMSGLLDRDEAQKIGSLLSIDALIMGRVYRTDKGFDIFVKVVDTGSGAVLSMFSQKYEGGAPLDKDNHSPWYVGTWKVTVTAPYLVEDDMRYEKLILNGDDTFSLYLINNADRYVEIKGRYSVEGNNIDYRAMEMYFDGSPTSFTRMTAKLEGTIYLVEGMLWFNYAGEKKKDRTRPDAKDARYRCVAKKR